jgi:hypothetical protein
MATKFFSEVSLSLLHPEYLNTNGVAIRIDIGLSRTNASSNDLGMQ